MRREFYVLLASLVLPQLRSQQLPRPVLAFLGSTDNGNGFTQYKFAITNYSDYPSELFQPAPDLPPCGRNRDASRTWVDILDPTGVRIYGFCALQSPAELGRLWFARRTGTAPPKSIRVVLTDRRTGRTVEGQLTLQSAGATGTNQAPAALRATEAGGLLSYEVINLCPYTITGYEGPPGFNPAVRKPLAAEFRLRSKRRRS